MLVMSETPFGSSVAPKLTWFANPVNQANGLVTLEFVDGTGRVISVDQAGNISAAPVGTAGPNELCKITGNVAIFFPAPQFAGPNAICQSFMITEVPQS